MYQSIGASSPGHQTEEGINDHHNDAWRALALSLLQVQGPHKDPKLQRQGGSPKRSGVAEENERLRELVRSLKAELADARCETKKFSSSRSQSTLGTEYSLSTHSREEDIEDDSVSLVRKMWSEDDLQSEPEFPAESYEDTSICQLIRARGGWLCLFMLSLSLTSLVVQRFESALEHDIQLANFLPLLLGHGGNAGGQTVSTVLAALAARQIAPRDGARVVAKEGLAGLGAGALTAAASVPFLYLTGTDAHAGITVPVTILLLTGVASCLAAGLPFAVLRLRLDPNVIAAPAMTTIVDVLGIILYFYIADAVLAIFHLDE